MNTQIHNNKILSLCAGLFALCAVGAAPAGVVAAENPWLEIHVMDRDSGRPLAGAAVCLGTQASQSQFGAVLTDARGVTRFRDLPTNPMVLVVSRPGYLGEQRLLEPLYENRVMVMKLAPGGGGPRCEGARSGQSRSPAEGLEITAASVARDRAGDDPRRVLVKTQLSGEATDIMISERPDFQGAKWQSYAAVVPYRLEAAGGAHTLYVQVRRYVKVNGATLEILSPVRKLYYQAR